jgi:hypothetical protein
MTVTVKCCDSRVLAFHIASPSAHMLLLLLLLLLCAGAC